MIKTNFEYNKEKDGQHSYVLSIFSDIDKNKYADIEFFNDGKIFISMTNRIDKPIIKEVNVDNIFIAIKELMDFIDK